MYLYINSEGLRQELEAVRWETLHRAAVTIQSVWRGYHCRKRWPALKRTLQAVHHPSITKGMKVNSKQIIIKYVLLDNSLTTSLSLSKFSSVFP